MAKKGKKTPSEAPLELDLNHPAIVAAQTVVDRWVRRVDESRGGLLESQKALRSITAQIEVVQQEVEEIRVEASLLWSLRLEDLRAKRDQNNSAARATSGAARKPARKSRSVSEEKVEKILSPAPSNTSELSFDGAAKNIEEKKRAKISIALQNLFRIPKGVSVQTCSTLSVPSLSHSAGASKLTTMQSITTPTAHDDDVDSQRASFKRKLSNSASLMNPMAVLSPATDYNNALPSPDHKKPRDVPAVLWDEMVLLRERRIHTDDRYDSLNRDLAGQMNRFELLQENSMISYYALESAAAALKKITMDCFHELERGRASTVLDRIGSPTDPPLTSEM